MNKDKILAFLTRKLPVYLLDEVDSTNCYSRKLIDENDDDFVVFSGKQNSGRGRKGHTFFSPDGGFYYSYVHKVTDAKDEILYTLLAGVATKNTVEAYDSSARIKWVNDIYLGRRKVSGILCEAVRDRDYALRYVIIGIGINVGENKYPDDIACKAVSLGKVNREEIFVNLTNELTELIYNYSPGRILEEYKDASLVLNKRVKYSINNEEKEGIAVDISANGDLVVETEKGTDYLGSGEISLKEWGY